MLKLLLTKYELSSEAQVLVFFGIQTSEAQALVFFGIQTERIWILDLAVCPKLKFWTP